MPHTTCMYNTATGAFECATSVRVTLHAAFNPSTPLLQGAASPSPSHLNFSLSNDRSPLPSGLFPLPVFLDYVLASGSSPLPLTPIAS
jgi:hypothetical protein